MIPYCNEPFTQFTLAENRREMEKAIHQVHSELGREIPLIIGGKRVTNGRWIQSLNPSRPDQVVGLAVSGGIQEAEEGMQAALAAFSTWKKVSAESRSRLLFKAAALLRKRKFEFNAWLCLEAGKSWVEADGDTAEAIDFLEYYGRQMLQLGEKQPLVSIPGEENWLCYIPLGVGVVIPPWNFPLAILVGMTAAAIVSGNTVVLKPASATPIIAYKFVELLEQAGMPTGVVNLVTGSGGEIGDYLVEHPKTRFISFTGSKEIGLRIHERASKINQGQIWLKRVVAEMGGKDAIVVHKDADIEWAAEAIVSSSFGFSGQKCSACSRVIAHEEIYDQLLARVVEKTRQLVIGDAVDSGTAVGPVIDQGAYEKILSYIEIGKGEGELVIGGRGRPREKVILYNQPFFPRWILKPRIMKEEIFGPVVAFTRAKKFLKPYKLLIIQSLGLNRRLFTRNRELIERAREIPRRESLFNRKCTGALVGVHPFGGFNMSGTDSKAGGRDYLLLFTQAKLSAEKL